MGTKTKTETKSSGTQTVAPPSWTMPGIQNVADKVTAATQLAVPEYTGNFSAVADYNPAIAAYSDAAKAAGGYAGQLDNVISGYKPVQAAFGMNQLPGFTQFQNPSNDAQMRGAITAESDAIARNFLTQVMPGLRSSALDAGAYSGDRAGAILPQLALDDATRNMSEVAGKYVYANADANANRELSAWDSFNNRQLAAYNADTTRGLGVAELGAGQQNNWLSQLPDLIQNAMNLRTGQGDILTNNANLGQMSSQQAIDNALQQHQYQVARPYEGLDLATQLLTQLSGNYGTTTNNQNSSTVQKVSGAGPIMQGILGAASLAASFPTGGGGTLMSSLFKPKAVAGK